MSTSERVPKQMQPTFDTITAMTDAFSAEHLDAEYAELCRRLTATLCRKRPSPLVRGRPEGWACAIVYALGRVNFLFDRSQTPTMSAGEICDAFGVSQSSASTKAKRILDDLSATYFDPRWTRPSHLEDNPLAWLLTVNGIPVDARYAPREIQEEAFRRGLIPYVPEPR